MSTWKHTHIHANITHKGILSEVGKHHYETLSWTLWGGSMMEYVCILECSLLFFKIFYFSRVVKVHSKEETKISCPHTFIASPLSTFPTRVVRLLELMNLHWHIIITERAQFTSGFTLGVVHSVGLGVCCSFLVATTFSSNDRVLVNGNSQFISVSRFPSFVDGDLSQQNSVRRKTKRSVPGCNF